MRWQRCKGTLHRRHRFRAPEEGGEAGERRPADESGVAPRLATALRDTGARFVGATDHRGRNQRLRESHSRIAEDGESPEYLQWFSNDRKCDQWCKNPFSAYPLRAVEAVTVATEMEARVSGNVWAEPVTEEHLRIGEYYDAGDRW